MSADSRPPCGRLRRFVAEINTVLLAEAHLGLEAGGDRFGNPYRNSGFAIRRSPGLGLVPYVAEPRLGGGQTIDDMVARFQTERETLSVTSIDRGF